MSRSNLHTRRGDLIYRNRLSSIVRNVQAKSKKATISPAKSSAQMTVLLRQLKFVHVLGSKKKVRVLVVAPENVDSLIPSTAKSKLHAATPQQNIEHAAANVK